MGESHHQTSSRLGLRNSGGGEIVEVQGGHIVRSTGRKDRHSKVCTAKGPRDRRVRLSAHTAIQFYDVQDRLGYDRPSKAVDWLIKKAKASIDELAELPAWTPTSTSAITITTTTTTATNTGSLARQEQNQEEQEQQQQQRFRTRRIMDSIGGTSGYSIQHQNQQQHEQMENVQQSNNNNQSFIPPSLDSDSIADTIKSFFPMGASAEATSSGSIQFQNYPPDLLSRTSSQSQDLRLSLQFQDPMLLQSQTHHHHHHHHHQAEQQVLFSGFDAHSAAGWPEHHQPAEISRLQRMVAWNAAGSTDAGGAGGGGGFVFNSLPPPPLPPQQQQLLQPLFGQSQFFSQRGPLQSSNIPSIRAWIDPSIADHHHQTPTIHHPSSISEFSGGFSGFHIPARIQGEEEHDGISNKPSSASSDSRH